MLALIAGRETKAGVAVGHAGALVHGGSRTLQSKTRQLTSAGATVFSSLESLLDRCMQYNLMDEQRRS